MRKKKLVVMMILFILMSHMTSLGMESTQSPPEILAETAVLMDSKTGEILFEKNMHQQEYPASITKVMTVLLGLEHGALEDVITMSEEAVFSVPRDASHIALDTGEQITLEQACMAAILPSANDASNGIAEYVSGSMEAFATLMNERAKEVGALNTHFVNSNGLPDVNHVSTAYDMAIIAREAIKSEDFRRIFGTIQYAIPPTNKQKETRYINSVVKMLKPTDYYYEGVVGAKSGYTKEALHTMVTVAQRNGHELIAVVMKNTNANDKYIDTANLFDYGFQNYDQIMAEKEAEAIAKAKAIQNQSTSRQAISTDVNPTSLNLQETSLNPQVKTMPLIFRILLGILKAVGVVLAGMALFCGIMIGRKKIAKKIGISKYKAIEPKVILGISFFSVILVIYWLIQVIV